MAPSQVRNYLIFFSMTRETCLTVDDRVLKWLTEQTGGPATTQPPNVRCPAGQYRAGSRPGVCRAQAVCSGDTFLYGAGPTQEGACEPCKSTRCNAPLYRSGECTGPSPTSTSTPPRCALSPAAPLHHTLRHARPPTQHMRAATQHMRAAAPPAATNDTRRASWSLGGAGADLNALYWTCTIHAPSPHPPPPPTHTHHHTRRFTFYAVASTQGYTCKVQPTCFGGQILVGATPLAAGRCEDALDCSRDEYYDAGSARCKQQDRCGSAQYLKVPAGKPFKKGTCTDLRSCGVDNYLAGATDRQDGECKQCAQSVCPDPKAQFRTGACTGERTAHGGPCAAATLALPPLLRRLTPPAAPHAARAGSCPVCWPRGARHHVVRAVLRVALQALIL